MRDQADTGYQAEFTEKPEAAAENSRAVHQQPCFCKHLGDAP